MSVPSVLAPPAYALYRATGLGRAFVDSVGEMFHEHEMTNDQSADIQHTHGSDVSRHTLPDLIPVLCSLRCPGCVSE